MLYGIIIGAVLLILIIFFISSYNGFVKLRNKVEEAFSTMDVYLKKRHDLVPNLVETVKGYAKHEAGTLEKVTAARNVAAGAATPEEQLKAEGQLTATLKTLFAVAENYPDLKANQNFMALQGQLTSLEGDIANSRKYYNGTVRQYNTATEVFPKNIVAGMFHFTRKPMFEVEDARERQNVKVEF